MGGFRNFAMGMTNVGNDIWSGMQQVKQSQYLQQQLQMQQAQQALDNIRLQIAQQQQQQQQQEFDLKKRIWNQLGGIGDTSGPAAPAPAPAPTTPFPFERGGKGLLAPPPSERTTPATVAPAGNPAPLLSPMLFDLAGFPAGAYKSYLQDQAARGNPLAKEELLRQLTPEQQWDQQKHDAYLTAAGGDRIKAAQMEEADKRPEKQPLVVRNIIIAGDTEPHDIMEDPDGKIPYGSKKFTDLGRSGEAFVAEEALKKQQEAAAESDAKQQQLFAQQDAMADRRFADEWKLQDARLSGEEKRQQEREVDSEIKEAEANNRIARASFNTATEAAAKAGFWNKGQARVAAETAQREYHLSTEALISKLTRYGRPIPPDLTQEPAVNPDWWKAYQAQGPQASGAPAPTEPSPNQQQPQTNIAPLKNAAPSPAGSTVWDENGNVIQGPKDQFFNQAGGAAQQQVESGGNPTARYQAPPGMPPSSASGLFGFINETWRRQQATYNRINGTNYNYPAAWMAPPALQRAIMFVTPVSNWGMPGAGSGGANARNPNFLQILGQGQ